MIGTNDPFLFNTGIMYHDRKYGNEAPKAVAENKETFLLYFYQILDYDLNMFEWINLPPEIDPRWVELVLIMRGAGVGFNDEFITGKYFFTDVALSGGLNVYHQPIEYRAYGVNGFNRNLDIDNSVICYNNYLRMPDIWKIAQFAERISDVQRTIDIALAHQKMPMFFTGDNKNVMSLKNLFKKITKNEPYVIISDKKMLSQIIANPSQPAYIIDKLRQEKTEIWNECMTFIGVDNVNVRKKERAVTDEINANNGQVELSRYTKLDSRRDFCKRFNAMYGTDLWVRYRSNEDKTNDEEQKENEPEKNIEDEKEIIKDENINEEREVD